MFFFSLFLQDVMLVPKGALRYDSRSAFFVMEQICKVRIAEGKEIILAR
jgi:hypothetical protein